MAHAATSLVCSATGRPAFAELRLGRGAAWIGSRHDGMMFVVVSPDVRDGAYGDAEIDRLLESGHIVAYGSLEEGLFPAGEIGLPAATELFIIGAGQVEEAIEAGISLSTAVRPITAALLGVATVQQGPDLVSLGRLWALQEYARGVRPLVDLDPKAVAGQVYADLVATERRQAPKGAVPAMRVLH